LSCIVRSCRLVWPGLTLSGLSLSLNFVLSFSTLSFSSRVMPFQSRSALWLPSSLLCPLPFFCLCAYMGLELFGKMGILLRSSIAYRLSQLCTEARISSVPFLCRQDRMSEPTAFFFFSLSPFLSLSLYLSPFLSLSRARRR
jgi:hypothetical protein